MLAFEWQEADAHEAHKAHLGAHECLLVVSHEWFLHDSYYR